jgi:hypothetical protein
VKPPEKDGKRAVSVPPRRVEKREDGKQKRETAKGIIGG